MEQADVHKIRVGERVFRYLYEKRAERAEAQELICRLSEDLPETVVFGGMIRDLALGSTRDFNSDIDLVSMADRATIFSLIQRYTPQVNKFGGFRFAVGRQLFDIWSFQDTWAFREGLVCAETFENLCATTFFNVDAACQPLKSKKIISSSGYLESLESRTLDINLEDNPAPDKVVIRAIRMMINKDLKASPRLQSYILRNAKKDLWKSYFTGSFLKLMEKHQENHTDLSFTCCLQRDLF